MADNKVYEGSIEDLQFDDMNFNKHTEYGMSLLERSIRNHKFGRSILVDKNNRIIGGNGVVETASQIGELRTKVIETTGDELVVVKRTDVDINTKEGREMAAADNAVAAADLDWDTEMLEKAIEEYDIDIDQWGITFDLDNNEEETKEVSDEEEDYEGISAPSRAVSGDVWLLGNHRLYCGDSTLYDSYVKLMGSDKADMVFTDPPYGVSATGGRQQTKKSLGMKAIENDELREDELTDFLCKFISVMPIKEDTSIYICYPWATQKEFTDAILMNDLSIKNCIIWDKKVFGLNGHKGYRPQYEMIYFCCKEDYIWYGDKAQSNIWQVSREIKREEQGNHPTPKPVELIVKAIENSSKKGDIVLDSFGGSGSTLIACEHTGRCCRMIELDPKYCDTIIARWEKVTGKTATRLEI